MPALPGSREENRADMLLALKVLGDMLEHRRVPLSVRGARALGVLITLATRTLAGDLPPAPFADSGQTRP